MRSSRRSRLHGASAARRSISATVLVALLAALAPAAAAGAASVGRHSLAPTDQARHVAFLHHLAPGQAAALGHRYPDFRILASCEGSFSGAAREDERVLGLWSARGTDAAGEAAVHRVALIADGQAWAVHDLEEDGRKDDPYLPPWQYAFRPQGFAGPMKCGTTGEFTASSDLTRLLGDVPFFDRETRALANNKPVCFATDDAYNNWDCFVYVPAAGRFRLWYRQAHAD